jgi:hypothetical protein
MVYFRDIYMCFFNLAEYAYFEKNSLFPPVKTMICRTYYLGKRKQASQEYNVLGAAASNIEGFL